MSLRVYQGMAATQPEVMLGAVSKSFAFVFGERVLAPVITYIVDGAKAFDGLFSRAINFIPGAAAEEVAENEHALTEWAKLHHPEMSRIADHAIALNNPEMLRAGALMFAPLNHKFFSDQTYKTIYPLYEKALKAHLEEERRLENEVEKCHQHNPGKVCKKRVISRRPDLEGTIIDDSMAIYKWNKKPGFLCWTIHVDGYYVHLFNKFFGSGGYNCDSETNRPTV